MLFSILICHLPGRAKMLANLLAGLQRQAVGLPVEILIDNATGPTGAKRNALLRRATGDYIAFVDDDDLVSADYVARIMAALETRPDVVGIELLMIVNGRQSYRCVHSLAHDSWFERDEPDGRVYYRCPNHLNPVRRELAIAAGFPGVTIGEDKVYSLALREMLKTEVMLRAPPLYLYRAGPRRDYAATPPAAFA